MQPRSLSSEILLTPSEIAPDEFDMLSFTDMAKRETLGKRLYEARQGLGLTARALARKIQQENRVDCGETTVRYLEQDKVPNPGVKTVEFHALGVRLDPLEMMGMLLDDPPDLVPGYKESHFVQLWKRYSKLSKDERAFYDDYVAMLIMKMDNR